MRPQFSKKLILLFHLLNRYRIKIFKKDPRLLITGYKTKQQIMIIKVSGFIDRTNSTQLENYLHGLFKLNCFQIIIDLHHLSYINSRGWHILISSTKKVRANRGDIKLARIQTLVLEIFEHLKLDSFLKSFNKVQDAIFDFKNFSDIKNLKRGSPLPLHMARGVVGGAHSCSLYHNYRARI